MNIQFENPQEAPSPAGFYSNVAIIPPGKKLLTLAGQIGNLKDGTILKGLDEQYEQALANVNAIVSSQGGTKKNIARITVFLTAEPEGWSDIISTNKKYLPSPPPAVTWIYVSKLFKPEVKVEIEAIAAVD